MRYRTLGSSDLQVSETSLGSWLTYSGGVAFEQTRACTDAAFDAGINFFDTANVYGRGAAESAWGEILSARPRDTYILATKVWGPMSDDPADRGLSAAQIAKQIDASLERLRTDYVDLYQCHRFDPDVPIEETIEALHRSSPAARRGTSASASGRLSRFRPRSTSPARTCSCRRSRSTR
jgi:aryl-alcohol dehydrogenase-like predicted oxidoreductase